MLIIFENFVFFSCVNVLFIVVLDVIVFVVVCVWFVEDIVVVVVRSGFVDLEYFEVVISDKYVWVSFFNIFF